MRNNKKEFKTNKDSYDFRNKKTSTASSYNKNFVKKDKPKQEVKSDPNSVRLNKYIANSGVCSRREADVYITSGNVKVNGEVVTELGYKVQLSDKVVFDGRVLSPEKKEYILLNKPKNFSTQAKEDGVQKNALDLVRSATKASLKPVGRMDKNTLGLLLFTNDDDIIRKFSKPGQNTSKIYQVSLDKNLKSEDLETISKGVFINEHKIFIEEISYIEGEPKTEIGIKLKTSNVKVVRDIFEKYNYNVLKVDRVYFAGLTKKNLPRGNWRFLTPQEIINLKNL